MKRPGCQTNAKFECGRYWCSRRYETADISDQVARQICIDTQPKKIKLRSYFHVKGDKNVNPLKLFLSKKTMFSLFPFFQAAEVAVTLKFQIRVGASNRHISARVHGHVFTRSMRYTTVNSKPIALCTTPQINRFVHQICDDCSPPPFPDRLSCLVFQ